jgi:osmotically-inducible protein OsmY
MRDMFLSDAEGLIDDDRLQRVIAERMESDPAFWLGRARKTMIAVDVEDGYATLSGIVRSPSDRRRADILARALGALGVDNRIQLEAELDRKRSA